MEKGVCPRFMHVEFFFSFFGGGKGATPLEFLFPKLLACFKFNYIRLWYMVQLFGVQHQKPKG